MGSRSQSAEIFAAAALEFYHGESPRFFDNCPVHKVFHFDGPHDSRPDLLVGNRLVDVGIVTEPKLQASLVATGKKIGTERWPGRYSWRVYVPLSHGPEGQTRYPRADNLRKWCLSSIRALETCMEHTPGQEGSCPTGQDFFCYLVHASSPLRRQGFRWGNWHFYAQNDISDGKHVEMLTTWGKSSPPHLFIDTITSIVNGDGSTPSDIKKKMDKFRSPEIKGREVFFVPDLDFLSSARLDIFSSNLRPIRMKRFITGVYVSTPSLGGVAHWERRTISKWNFKPFHDDFKEDFQCLEGDS